MNLTVREEDRRAMDLVLDRAAVAAGKSSAMSAYASTDGQIRQRVAHIEKVLNLLDNIVVDEPPRQLINRTLRLVKHTSGRDVTAGRDLSSHAFTQPPVA